MRFWKSSRAKRLINEFHFPSAEKQEQIISKLVKLKDDNLVDNLISFLNMQVYIDSDIRKGVIRTLGKMKEARAVNPLIAILGSSRLDSGITAWEIRDITVEALVEIGPSAIEYLIDFVIKEESEDSRVLIKPAIKALGRLKDPRAIEPLKRIIEDSRHPAAVAAAEALDDLDKSGIYIDEYLRQIIKERIEINRREIEGSRKEIEEGRRQKEEIEGLINFRLYLDNSEKNAAIHRLVEIGLPVVNLLIAKFKSNTQTSVRVAAARALAQIKDKRCIEGFIQALLNENETWEVRAQAAWGIGEIGDQEAVNSLIHILDVLEPGDSTSERVFYDMKHYSSIRREIVYALGKIGSGTARMSLERTLHDRDFMVAGAAKYTLTSD